MAYTPEELKRMMRNLEIDSEYIRKLTTRPPSAFRKDSRTDTVYAVVTVHDSELNSTFLDLYADLLRNSKTYFTHLDKWDDFETEDILKELQEYSKIETKQIAGKDKTVMKIPKFYNSEPWPSKDPINRLPLHGFSKSCEDEWHLLCFQFKTDDYVQYPIKDGKIGLARGELEDVY